MIHVLGSPDAAAGAAAARVARVMTAAIEAHGRARIALSGGRTPGATYRGLAAPPLRERIDWSRVDVLFADERAVAADDRDSNLRLVRETLLQYLPGPGPRVVRMRADAVPTDEALAEYERELETPLDLVLLGIGPDGHTASLFPGSPLLSERERRVAMVLDSPKPPARRMTLLPRAIQEADAIVVLVSGADKSQAVARALEGDAGVLECPARMLRERSWFLDLEAAEGLSHR